MNNELSFYLGRAVSWLEAVTGSGALNDLTEAKASIAKVIEKARTNEEPSLMLFGQAVSWLESISATGGLSVDAKEKTEKLLTEIKVCQKKMLEGK